MSLKDTRFILGNLTTYVQKEMNENELYRESIYEDVGLIKYKSLKQAVLELIKRQEKDLKNKSKVDTETQIYNTLTDIEEIFGDWEK